MHFTIESAIHKTCKAAFSELKATKTLLEKEITLEKLKVYQKANDYLFGSSSFIRSRLMVSSLCLSGIFFPWALSPLLVGIAFGVCYFLLLVAVVLSGVVIAKCLEYLSREVRLADAVNGIVETVEKQLRPDQVVTEANVEPVAEKLLGP